MRPSKSLILVDKAIQAAISAIEVYNKPSFQYREEAFAILIINAWELLLKARILKENNNRVRSIEIWEFEARKAGAKGRARKVAKQTRSGNNFTIGLQRAAQIVRGYSKDAIDELCVANIELLTEIRDCAVHFHNKGRALQKQLQEVGSAALKNFSYAAHSWFKVDLSEYNFSIMPIAFETPEGLIKTVFEDMEKGAAKRVLKLISEKQAAYPFDPTRPFNVGVKIEMRFVRTASPAAIIVQPGPAAPDAIPLVVTEEDALAAYPWRFRDLTRALKKRYSDFKQNDKFVKIKRAMEKEPRFCKERRLDPKNAKSSKQMFYNPNVIREFDAHYTQRPPPIAPEALAKSATAPG